MEEIIIDECKYKFQDKEKFNGKPYCTLFNELCEDVSFVCDKNCQVFEDYKKLKQKEKDYNELENTSVEIIREYKAKLNLALQLINKTLEQFGLTQYDWQEDQNEITTELQKFVDSKKEIEELKEDVKHKELEIQDWIKQYKLAHQKRIKLQTKYNKLEQKANKYIHDIVDENVKDISNISKVCKSLEKENDKLKQALQEIKEILCCKYPYHCKDCVCNYYCKDRKVLQKLSEVEE